MKNFALLSLFTILLFSACGPDYIVQKSIELPTHKWSYADSIYAEVEITDTMKLYNLYLDIDHSTSYSNQNLYLFIKTRFPDGQLSSQQLSVDLADKQGNWQGKCNSEQCHLRIYLQDGAFFNSAGNYSFSVAQHMRVDSLPGILGLGFSIEDRGELRK